MTSVVFHRGYLLACAFAAAAVAVVLFSLYEQPGRGLGHLFYIPIALLALAGGRVVGVAAGLGAVGMWAAGAQFAAVWATPETLSLRAVGFVSVGALIGWYATEYRRLMREAERRAGTDALTGVGNTHAFRSAVAARIASGRPFGLVLCDLDDLKKLNDSEGHERGDRALIAVAAGLHDLAGDDGAFRIGGDEFVALVEAGGGVELEHTLRQLDTGIRARGCSTSLGAAAFPADAQTAEALLAVADRRMYDAKSGRGAGRPHPHPRPRLVALGPRD